MQGQWPQALALWLLPVALIVQPAWSSDACSTRAVVTRAAVTASDGMSYSAVTHFQSRDMAAVTMIDEATRTFAIEGPFGWASAGGRAEFSDEQYKAFALGHQYHALLLYFDDIVIDARPAEDILFRGEPRTGVSGDYPYGGLIHLVHGDSTVKPAGIILELPGAEPIAAIFGDWREAGGRLLPYSIDIDDGQRVFEYRYLDIELGPAETGWFHTAVEAPPIDTIRLHRLHRDLLAAHCRGDAQRMAELSTPEVVVANRGELSSVSNAAMQAQFTALFEQLDYVAYTDVAPAVIDVAESGDIGWIAVSTRAEGTVIATGERFGNQWAWVMMARKIDGKWRHAGNASNVAR